MHNRNTGQDGSYRRNDNGLGRGGEGGLGGRRYVNVCRVEPIQMK